MHRPILGCATDLGPSGDQAVAWSVALARASGAHVALLHAVEDPDGIDSGFLAEPMNPILAAYRERLAERKGQALEKLVAVQRSVSDAGIPCSIELASGRPWTAVIAAAKHVGADLLVLGPHGVTPPDESHLRLPRLLGSTSDPALRHADRPVLLCPATTAPNVGGAAWTALVAVDLGPTSGVVLDWAARLRRAFGFEPTLLHVLRGPIPAPFAETDEAFRDLEGRARARLEALAAEWGLADAPLLIDVAPSAAAAIERKARALDSTIIVAGAGAAPAWAQAFVGSTAERLVRHGERPVCVARCPTEGFALTDKAPPG